MSKSQQVAAEALSLLQTALEESEARVEQLEKELERRSSGSEESHDEVGILEQQLEQTENERRRHRTEAGQLEEVVENLNAKIDRLEEKLEVAESGPDKLTKKEINFWRAKAESFDEKTSEYKERIAALRRELKDRDEELAEQTASIADEPDVVIDPEEFEATQKLLREASAQAAAATEKLRGRDAAMSELSAKHAQLETEAGQLKYELKEERECAENLSEVANNRLDELNSYREQQEEAQERLEEAEWRLRKSQHFERLVQRRKGLVASLIVTIRAKMKANTALKAGLDSLRRYKASSQDAEQKLLAEIDRVKAELGRTKEALEQRKDSAQDRRQLSESNDRVKELEERVSSQAEVNKSLAEELKVAKLLQSDLSNKTVEARQLIEKNEEALEVAATDALADRESDRLVIHALEKEVAELRKKLSENAISARSAGQQPSNANESEAIKALEAKIAELSDETAAWKRKYEFLSTEAPDAYQNQAAAEK
ncbi:MAG: hypothetical protein ACR2QQ_12620 [Gammaproteobacteria bacterium]